MAAAAVTAAEHQDGKAATSASHSVDPSVRFADETHLDAEWLGGLLGLEGRVKSAELHPLGRSGGLSGMMRRVEVEIAGEGETDPQRTLSLVLKSTNPGKEDGSKALGLVREALFMQKMLPELASTVRCPRVYASFADLETGVKHILMEDLGDYILLGHLFGAGSPHNDGVDLEDAIRRTGGVTAERAAAAAFLNAARLHAAHWMDKSVTAHTWLRGAGWPSGDDKELWDASIASLRGMWETGKALIGEGEGKQSWWNDEVVALIENSLARASWEEHVARFERVPWTLVHGDFHPANMLFRPASKDDPEGSGGVSIEQAMADLDRLVLVDFEVVGIGSGPQDLGQFMISHADAEMRRKHEPALLQLYHEELGRRGVDTTTFDMELCKEEYAKGAVERWVWLLGFMSGCCPEGINRFLHDQLLDFMRDHGVNASNVGGPRC